MEALRVGGLASGLDTNSIIDSLMTKAKEPINRLNNQVENLTFEKKSYNDIITSLNNLKTALLPLKMESTFKSKLTTSSKEDVASGAASINTPPGSYTVKVEKTAEPAYASSIYTNKSLTLGGAGVKALRTDVYPYDQVEGTHNVTITDKGGGKWVAKDVFSSKDDKKYTKMSGGAMDSALIDGNGKLKTAVDEKLTLVYTYEGQTQTMEIELKYAAGTYSSTIAQDLEQKINAGLDAKFTKDGRQQLAVRTDMDEATGAFSFGFYDTTGNAKVDIVGFIDPADADGTGGTAKTLLAKNLGLFTTGAPVETKEITNVIVSNTAENLAIKINHAKGGLFPGSTLEFNPGGLTEGHFTVYQDSSVNSRPASKSTFYGASMKAITDAVPPLTDAQIQTWLSSSLNASTSYFDKKPSSTTNGFFHINGVKIEIEDYSRLTPESLMAKINGSGAGVTASFDMESKTFKIESNETGAGDVTLGKDGDTSDIFSVMKLSITAGSTYIRGKSEGNIDTSAVIKNDPGYTIPVTSGIFTINGVSIYVDTEKDTTDDIIAKVNKSGAGVIMAYDQNTDKFTLTGKTADRIKLGGAGDSSTFLLAAGLLYSQTTPTETGTEGSDAIFTVNGTKYQRKNNTVKDVIPGMTLNLTTEGTTVLNVKVDTERAVEAVAEFAATYNELINKLSPVKPSEDEREKYSEKLTADEKKDMKEDDIKEYEANYERIQYYDLVLKSSELRMLKYNIRTITSGETNLENNMFKSLSSLGILTAGAETGDISITKLGLLINVSTDKEELAKFLKEQTDFASTVEENSDEVFRFFAEKKETEKKDKDGNIVKDADKKPVMVTVSEGWARTYDTFIVNNTTTTSPLYKKAGTNGTLDTKISNLKEQIETQTKRAESYLERMWAQFSAMEQRVQNYQTQASYLTGISGGQNQ